MSTVRRLLAYLERQSPIFLWLAVLVSTLGLGIIDYQTGPGFSMSLFYIFPVALASWALGNSEGMLTSFACAASWAVTNLRTDQRFSDPLVYLWNTAVFLGSLLIVSLLVTALHELLRTESHLSRTDFLTGIQNRRGFFESAAVEIKRLARTGRPFTLLFMDLDNFKSINDARGHAAGDTLLTSVATILKLQLRGIDIVARMGGDEFAAILPETGDQAARKVAPRLQGLLLEEMQNHQWPITFSMGALSCVSAPPSPEEMFQLADQLVHSAKEEGKNTISYKVYSR
ncbi:MAG TPA: GGDEF domain-containing protein [Anaerolineales bacterium]|nr:GGDEF domain-containing protein [Anaerolineales bacterium]